MLQRKPVLNIHANFEKRLNSQSISIIFFFTVNDSLRQIFFAREYLTNANNSNEHLKICGKQ